MYNISTFIVQYQHVHCTISVCTLYNISKDTNFNQQQTLKKCTFIVDQETERGETLSTEM